MEIPAQIRNFVIISHIDHGKSTLADRLLEFTGTVPSQKMRPQYLDQMDLERERGVTIKMAPVRMLWHQPIQNAKFKCAERTSAAKAGSQIENSDSTFILNLIDTPGHADFQFEVIRALQAVEGAILLVDATQGIQAQTLMNLSLAQKENLVIIPVINKIDLPMADIEKTEKQLESLGFPQEEILKISAKTGKGVKELLETIIRRLPPPQTKENAPLQALIFDAKYDAYKGAVAYVRLFSGRVKKGEKIKLLSSGLETEVLEVGYFLPELTPCEMIGSGEIGYIKTGLKEIAQIQIGDSITEYNAEIPKSKEKVEAPQALIFASIYPLEGGDFPRLLNAIQKLKLNDASISYQPETSKALGAGLRCGFLGLFHLEITKERLERHFALNIIVTRPQVEIRRHDSVYQEPYVRLEIVTPPQFMGKIMQLVPLYRGKFLETQYLSDKVILRYEMPLAEVITDFYDNLKNVSSGFASVSYKVIGFRQSDLVELDVLVAGEKIEPLSQIVAKEKVYSLARDLVKKLKEIIPRQLFEVSLQAAIKGKIVAREDIPALKKNVTAHLYGGDITRKRKLWEKQAAGKRRLKKLGKVEVPTDIFIKLLKK